MNKAKRYERMFYTNQDSESSPDAFNMRFDHIHMMEMMKKIKNSQFKLPKDLDTKKIAFDIETMSPEMVERMESMEVQKRRERYFQNPGKMYVYGRFLDGRQAGKILYKEHPDGTYSVHMADSRPTKLESRRQAFADLVEEMKRYHEALPERKIKYTHFTDKQLKFLMNTFIPSTVRNATYLDDRLQLIYLADSNGRTIIPKNTTAVANICDTLFIEHYEPIFLGYSMFVIEFIKKHIREGFMFESHVRTIHLSNGGYPKVKFSYNARSMFPDIKGTLEAYFERST